MTKRNWAERWVAWVGRRPVLVLVFFISALLGSISAVVTGGIAAWHWFDRTVNWREYEYDRLHDLKAGFAIQKFREVLGSPTFERSSTKGRLRESSFRGRGYWVQAIWDRQGTVLLYAVTTCDGSLKPTFPAGDFNAKVTLNESTLASVRKGFREVGVLAEYYAAGATENSYFFDWYYGGNPTNYKSFAWGLNDACPDWGPQFREFYAEGLLPFDDRDRFDSEYMGPVSRAPSGVQRFREAAVVNTYCQTAPGVDFEKVEGAFQVGVDRILIRTLYE